MENETVTLIASGYDWECPNCDDEEMNNVPVALSEVQCPKCLNRYQVLEVVHAQE